MVDVRVHEGKVDLKAIMGHHVVIVTDTLNGQLLEELGDFCHNKDIGFIVTGGLGLYGYLFVDFGEKHKITDKNGENLLHAIISHIGKENPAVVTCHEEHRHGLEDG